MSVLERINRYLNEGKKNQPKSITVLKTFGVDEEGEVPDEPTSKKIGSYGGIVRAGRVLVFSDRDYTNFFDYDDAYSFEDKKDNTWIHFKIDTFKHYQSNGYIKI